MFSLPVLIARGLDLQFLCRLNLVSLFLCLVFRVQKCSWSPIQGQAKADMDRKRKRKRNKAEDGESRRKRKEVFSDGVGVFNGEGPPVPIPNTEVKLTSADDTCLATSRENRSMPTQKKNGLRTVLFLCWASHILQGEPCKIPRCARRCLAAQDALTRIEFEAGFAAPSSSPAGSRHNKRSKSKRSRTRKQALFALGVTYFARRTLQNTSLRSALRSHDA